MRKSIILGTSVLAISLALAGCSNDTNASSDTSSSDTSSVTPAADAKTGTFEGLSEKKVSGSVSVDDEQIIVSDFVSDEGPDLHVYLTNGTDEASISDGVEIDLIAFDKASQSFALDGIDTADYSTVVIYCDKAKAIFGAASLS